MRKIFLLSVAAVLVFVASVGYAGQKKPMTVKLYFVDSSMQRLIPTDFDLSARSTEEAARIVISELLEGRDNNTKIMRLIPDIENGLEVEVRGQTAYVNMTSELVENHSDARSHELLTIYSIVNSLTSVEGITKVKFTIDNKQQKDFKGFCDMRETFIPDYCV